MSQAANDTKAPEYILPVSLVGHADLSRLLREVEAVDSNLQAQKVRASGQGQQPRLPALSQSLQDFLEQNNIDLADGQVLLDLKDRLRAIKDHAPVVHMVFAGEADEQSLEKIVTWLRTEAHPQALLTVGRQPSLVGGVYIRTPNKVLDFSAKALLQGKSDIIVKQLEALRAR